MRFSNGQMLTFEEVQEFKRTVARGKPQETEAEPVDLTKVNVADLAEALAGVGDVQEIRAAKEADSRSSAQARYDSRLAELED